MRSNRIRVKSSVIYFISIILIILFSYKVFIYYEKYIDERVVKEISYFSTDNSSFDVYYDGGSVIRGKAKEEGFIRKYVDYVNLNYDYTFNFSDVVSGIQESLVKSMLIIYAPNSETPIYKSDTDYLVPSKKTEYENTQQYKYNNKVKVDYKKYLNIYEKFKEETSIVSNAKIQVEFISSNIANSKDLPKIVKTDTITYSIPLSDVTFSIEKKSNITSERKSVKALEKNNNEKNKYLYLISINIIIILIAFIIMLIRYLIDRKRTGKYKNQLNKILKSYDNIIVNIKSLPSLKDKRIMNVTSFNELLDAQMETRIPINYCEKKKNSEAYFIIIEGENAWIYILKNERR